MTRSCFVHCPGNNCGDLLAVVIDAEGGWMGTDIPAPTPYYRITDHPAVCRGCRTQWDRTPLELDQATLATAYAEGE